MRHSRYARDGRGSQGGLRYHRRERKFQAAQGSKNNKDGRRRTAAASVLAIDGRRAVMARGILIERLKASRLV